MKKAVISIGLAVCLLVSCVGFSGCSAESQKPSQKPSEPAHTHNYVNGVCPEDGSYETDFILKGRVPEIQCCLFRARRRAEL